MGGNQLSEAGVEITLTVPGLLRDCTGGKSAVVLEAATLRQAFAAAFARFPTLKTHLFDESGAQRPHVLIFLNEENIAWLADADPPLKRGDRLQIIQAVSGG